jgi:hypothetical protein
MEEIDGIDNGISTHDGEGRYAISTNLSRRVGNFSPRWNDPEQVVGTVGRRSTGSQLGLFHFQHHLYSLA